VQRFLQQPCKLEQIISMIKPKHNDFLSRYVNDCNPMYGRSEVLVAVQKEQVKKFRTFFFSALDVIILKANI